MSFVDDSIANIIEPVPTEFLEGYTGKDKKMRETGYRMYERLKKHHSNKAPAAPKMTSLDSTRPNSYSVRGDVNKLKITKLTIPSVLKKFQKGSSPIGMRSNSTFSNEREETVDRSTAVLSTSESVNTTKLKEKINVDIKPSPSERIGALYTPSCEGLTPVKLKARAFSLKNSFDAVSVDIDSIPYSKESNSSMNKVEASSNSMVAKPKPLNMTVIVSKEFDDREKEIILSDDQDIDIGSSRFLPLELFDGEEGELYTPNKWVALGKDTGGTRAKSNFFDGKEYSWQPCRVLDYEDENSTYLIKWELNQQTKYVKRLNLCFDDEDWTLFKQRIRMAMIRRIHHERQERYMLQVDKVDNADVSSISEDQVDRILSLVASEFPVKHLDIIEEGVAEMKENYTSGVKLSIFEYFMQHPLEREKCSDLDLPEPKRQTRAPYSGVISIPQYDFNGIRDYIDKHIFYSHRELIDTLRTVHEQIRIFKDDKMIDIVMEELSLPCKLEDWSNLQNKTITRIANKLKDDWSSKATTVVQNGLNGSNNFYEDDIERFKGRRLYRVLRLINLIMSFQLRDMSRQALQSFATFMEQFQVDENEKLMPLDVNGKTPLFSLEVVVNNKKCELRPSMDTVSETIKYMFDNVLDDTDTIPGVGPKLFPLLTLDERDYILPNLKKDDPITKSAWLICEKIINDNMIGPQQLLDMFKEFEVFLSYDIEEYTTNFLSDNMSLDKLREELRKLYDAAQKIQHKSLDEVKFNLFLVQCGHIKDVCVSSTLGTANSLLRKLSEKGTNECNAIREAFEVVYEKIQVVPQNAEELAELKDYLMKVSLDIEALQSRFGVVQENFKLLNEFSYNTSEEHFRTYIETYGWPKKVYAVLQDSNIRLEEDKRKFMDELTESLATLVEDIDKYSREMFDFAMFDDIEYVEEYYQKIQDMHQKIADAKSKAQQYNNRERMFNWKQTEFIKLTELAEAFEPTENLWTIAYQESQRYPEWMDGQFKLLNPTEVETNALTWFDTLKKLEKKLADSGPKQVATNLRKKLADFKKHIPLITALRNDGLRGRHWQKISALVGKPIDTNNLTFRDLLDMNLDTYLAQIQEISAFASQELKITRGLQEMEDSWKAVAFQLGKYGTTWKLVELDDLQTMLDEHIVLTQSMRSSPYVKEIELDVISWERKLLDRQDILDQWILCQVAYLYLEPIFTSQDIATQLPDEATKFNIVDKSWRAVMDMANKTKIVTEVMTMENLLQNFQEHNKMLDEIHKGLKDYLETKRRKFPRFYFLADDELLEILSETKDPLRVQPHLRKCFEGIDKLDFTDDKEITAMMSKEQERIDFTRNIVPNDYSGKVELWLLEIEKEMRASVRNVIEKAIVDYASTKRSKWILDWQGQVVLAVSQMFWTREVEEAIRNGGVKGIQKYLTRLEKQMKELIDIVRGKLTPLQRITLGALVVMDVHAKDVVANLVKEEVNDISDFEWQSQLRFYWEGDSPQLIVRQVTAQIEYGYEYLGNTPRLVITPLTDRCYRTLMGALQLHKGGAPEGPAGTGKTETTKDLAKAIAKFCVVYNCSDTLDAEGMEKFFKGLASSGAWSCFDEFNRIQLEVLSVVAQQIQQIQLAVAAKQKRFFFEGFEIDIDPSCAIFITMNPGYAGRSELPDNLKTLFRPVAMMIPDYAMIAEISLFSYGFYEGRNLARKIVATYRLCSEQLSSQDHYDYGMRAVKSVLVRAGTLKQQYPDDREDELMLRSLMDVNLPKFLAEDIPLFEGIISDLFPTVNVPKPNYSELIQCMEESCNSRVLQPLQPFIDKCIQLYEMIIVRHGLMLVGNSFSGKTSSYRVLRDALYMMNQRGLEEKVQIQVINPKSITMGQLYGSTDIATKEWKDGILAIHFRKFSESKDNDRKWLIFDGPVDAIWIESMNTVLDDNKKLCLPNGQIVKMSDSMNLIFEVQDLAVASPATVSRCGMVYMEPSDIGWKPMVQSWMNRDLPLGLQDKATTQQIWQILDCLVPKLLDFIYRNVKEYLTTSRMTLTNAMLNLFESLLDEFRNEEVYSNIKPKDKTITVESLLIFAIVWSFGATGDETSRKLFDKYLRNETEGSTTYKFVNPFPNSESVYDYSFDNNKRQWIDWLKTIPPFSIPKETSFQDIIVPTTDTTRYSFLLDTLITHQKPVLFVGLTGTGKTLYIKQRLLYGLDREKYVPNFLNMSARTSANQTQDILESKFDRRKKGTIGAPIGKKLVVFVDDLNLPALEEYGAQPPIELLRQFMDHGGWYDRHDKQGGFTNIVDVQFVCAMGPPGGGRNPVTARYTRHFNIIGLTPFDNTTLKTIFSEIINWFLSGSPLMSFGKQVVAASLDMYNSVANIFLPTPAKSHYTFNLRDLSKIFQGMCQANIKHIGDKSKLLRLWCHESMRVFQDRLVSSDDRAEFNTLLKQIVHSQFNVDIQDLIPNKVLVYASFMDKDNDDSYVEVNNIDHLTYVINRSLDEYNDNPSHQKMDLVLFKFAIDHISRISRIISQPYGNALLIGVGGSGRQSLTKLATFLADLRLYQITLTKKFGLVEWKDRMKTLLRQTGIDGVSTVFLFSDTQIKDVGFLEDISNLLNTGEIPNLFALDELKEIFEILRPIARKNGKDQSSAGLYNLFVERCRNNLHIVVCMSPIGDSLRNYLRMFPSLVNCCTIDWFSEWPSEALHSVALNSFKNISLLEGKEQQCVDVCVYFHNSVTELSKEFLYKTKRHNYVTPTTYLDMLQNFEKLSTIREEELTQEKLKYDTGLERIAQTEKEVAEMQLELEKLQPELVTLSEQNEQLSLHIKQESEEANDQRKIVEAEEVIMQQQNEENQKVREYCAEQLAKALPALVRAQEAIKNLKDQDIVEVRALQNPPEGVKTVMKVVCILKGIPPAKKSDDFGRKEDDWWTPSKKMMGEKGFLGSIRNFDAESIKDENIAKLLPVINSSDFSEEKIKNANKAAQNIRAWLAAMVEYHESNKVVKPRKAALEKAEAEYTESMRKLEEKKAMIRALEDKLDQLAEQLRECIEKKNRLQSEYEDVSTKLERAQQLIGLLSGEKERWSNTSRKLDEKRTYLIGDMLLSSGVISYLGAFTGQFRDDIILKWKNQLKELRILYSPSYSLAKISGDVLKIRQWNIQGLPADNFSIDNAIIVENTRRWPLFIDPQGQARNWIKKYEEEKGSYLSIKMSDPNLVRSLEQAIELGTAAIIENVGEEIDPALEPLLLKQTKKVAGQVLMQLSDKPVIYKESFRLYLITSISNPHYLPEVSTKVTLVNFMITPTGLQDQLLQIVVMNEERKLEDEKNRLVKENAESLIQLKKIDNDILELLVTTPKEEVLGGTKVINTLSNSKQVAKKTSARQAEATKMEIKIDEKRNHFNPVALNGSVLFFCVMELPNVDPMYQFSLKWFKELFTNCITETKQDGDRIHNLTDHFTYSLYQKICRALFEKDKLLLSLLMCISLMQQNGSIDRNELRFLLTGGTLVDSSSYPNPTRDWISEKAWTEINNLTALKGFEDFRDSFVKDIARWRNLANNNQPHLEHFPGKWQTPLQKMLIIRILRPDRLVPAIAHFITSNMDERFIKPPTFNLRLSYNDSSCTKPLVFVLSPGVDPMERLRKFADSEGRTLDTLSLGQNQGPKAVDMISKALVRGNWVVLQNCHLDVNWLPTLEKIVEEFDAGKTAETFRLWLTSMPSSKFPVSILQNSIKITDEPPKGLRANLMKSWTSDLISEPTFFSSSRRPRELKKLLFGLCFFHALVQERRQFGPLGWNIPYEFNESDLRISTEQLRMFLNHPYIPFKALSYLTGECNYGGRVTDDHDRRTLMAILGDYYNQDILSDSYRFSLSGLYYAPKDGDHVSYLDYISTLPLEEQPEVFGLNDNASITKNQAEAMAIFNSFSLTQERGSSGGGDAIDQIVFQQAEEILSKMPQPYNIEAVKTKYPISYNDSMNTVLIQELIRYNKLIKEIRETTRNVQKAIKGEVVMSEQLESLSNSLFDNKIPELWRKKSYPSCKSLGGYIIDLLRRLEFFQKWIDSGPPTVFWISGFFFTQSFLTGVKQNYARQKKIEIDTIEFDFEVMKTVPIEPATIGCYVDGLFLEGARWDPQAQVLGDSQPKKLYDELPVLWLKPREAHLTDHSPHYPCPVYKTSERRGTLSTTGHSTNFVMTIKLPSDQDEKHWVKRGCALLCQLD